MARKEEKQRMNGYGFIRFIFPIHFVFSAFLYEWPSPASRGLFILSSLLMSSSTETTGSLPVVFYFYFYFKLEGMMKNERTERKSDTRWD
ncbi:hypothetical protein J2Z66_001459 [Paenibacillus eucommiae]|uniref:Transmembrane protein n=1 Tax=Paenibacillus eucommiae TaxID=1355755 RepID=A0ABS4ISK5_9BACL|nr:hypothetical protein [Paenibacillus eucommiae]